MKPQPTGMYRRDWEIISNPEPVIHIDDVEQTKVRCQYGTPGDLLWVREACVNWREQSIWKMRWLREADNSPCSTLSKRDKAGRRAAFHMPRIDSRLTLRITDVRVERLQEISEVDARAEGIEQVAIDECLAMAEAMNQREPAPATCLYSDLWEGIHGAGSWGANPWVWALTFVVLTHNVDKIIELRQVTA